MGTAAPAERAVVPIVRTPDQPATPRERLRGIIAELHANRRQVAKLNQRLGELERERKLKRVTLTNSLYGQPNPMTGKNFTQEGANDGAQVHPEHTALVTTISGIQFERDVLLAECETRVFQLEVEIAAMRAVGVGR